MPYIVMDVQTGEVRLYGNMQTMAKAEGLSKYTIKKKFNPDGGGGDDSGEIQGQTQGSARTDVDDVVFKNLRIVKREIIRGDYNKKEG